MATQQTILRRPKFDLRFVTEETTYQVRYDSKRPDNNFMTESIISVDTKNALEDDTAAFSFVLSGDMEWDKLLRENDMVILNIEPNEYAPNNSFGKDKPRTRTVIVGLVSEVRIEGSYGDNSKMYRITGQSFQKAFANFELRSIRQAGHATGGSLGWMDWQAGEGGFSHQLMGKNVTQVVTSLMDRFVDNRELDLMKYNFTSEHEEKQSFDRFFENQIVYSFSSWHDDELLMDPIPITSYEGSLNQLIKEIASAPFLEYFFDVFPSSEGYEKVWMVIRRTPFDEDDWKTLYTYILRTRDVISENFGRTDLEAFSIYNVVPEINNEDMALASAVPWYSPELVEKYGYKMLEVSSRFIALDTEVSSDGDQSNSDEFFEGTVASRFGKKLYNWYANNPNFYSGDITVVGHPDYRVGNRLIYKNSKNNEVWEFYIESVEHTFTYEDGYTTKLGVTRGLRVENENDHGIRFKPLTGKPKRFKGGYMKEMSLEELEEHRKAEQAKLESMSGEGSADSNIDLDFVGSGGIVKPADGRLTSDYGMRIHPITGKRKMHNGLDIAGVNRDIRSMSDGIVKTVTRHPSYGNYVEISHGSINNLRNVSTLYAHMNRTLVKPGERVSAGQSIGIQGMTGSATGVHLHFEVKVNGKRVDPKRFVKI